MAMCGSRVVLNQSLSSGRGALRYAALMSMVALCS